MAAIRRSEDELRDHLAAHLELIESGLTLIKTEYRLRNIKGAGGYIDILARDDSGDLVVIELKRSDNSARQALHELEKYVGLLAADRGVRVDRLRCILVATVWRELLVPFTRFLRHADFHVYGRVLLLGDDGFTIGSERVQSPTLVSGLEICPLHLNLLFSEQNERDAAAFVVAETLADLFVEDYITIVLNFTGDDSRIIHRFSFYVVFAEFTEALRDFTRVQFPDDCEEEPADSPWWHEQLAQRSVVNAVCASDVEVGSPERLGALDGWEVAKATGCGRYSEREVWAEDELVRTALAMGDTYSMPFARQVKAANVPAWTRMRKDLDRCLLGAGQWPELVSTLLDEVARRTDAEVKVHAYVPNDLLFGLQQLIRTGATDYLPELLISVKEPARRTLIGGILRWDGRTRVSTPDQTLGVVFGDFMTYMVAHVTGSVREVETRLCELHGLTYDLQEWDVTADVAEPVRISSGSDGRLARTLVRPDEPTAREFVDAHREYLTALAEIFERSSMGLPD